MLSGNAKVNAWYAENREAITARRRAIYAENSKLILASAKVRRSRASYKQHAIEYAQRNNARISAYSREYSKKNRESRRISDQNRNARLRETGGSLSKGLTEKLLKLQSGMCINCRCDLGEAGYHLDHIVPLSLGGPNEDFNIQLLCPTCNLKKHAKDPITWAQEQGRLL